MVNVWNAYQCMVTFNLSRSASFFESGIGRGMGFRDSNQDLLGFVHMVPGRARERILDIAATQLAIGRRLPPVPAADEARQRRDRLRLQRRPALADPRRRRLPQGDRRPRRSSTSRCRTTTSRAPRRRSTSTSQRALALHARPARPARAAADRARRLERLPEPQLLLGDAGRVVPDDREPARAASPSRCSSPACSRWRPRSSPRSPTAAALADEARRYRAAREAMAAAVRAPRLGRRVVPARLRLLRARRSARPTNDEGQIFIEPQGMCVMAGHRPRRRQGASRRSTSVRRAPGDAARDRARPAGLPALPPRARRDQLVPARLQGERRRLLPHEPVDHDRRDAASATATRAFDYYLRINPSAREEISDVHRCEPYVYAQMIAGTRRADARRGEELLAHRHRGLELRRDHAVDPRHPPGARRPARSIRAFPSDWEGFTATPPLPRRDLPDHASASRAARGDASRRSSSTARRVEGNLVPLAPPGATVEVQATIES